MHGLWRRFGRDSDGIAISLQPLAPPRVNWLSATVVHVDGREVDWTDLVWVPRMTFPTLRSDSSWLIRLAREAIAAAWAAAGYTSDFWEAGGAPVIYIKSEQALSQGDADTISDRYTETRAAKPGRAPVFGKGAELKTLGADVAGDGASGAASKLGTSIARYFGMPPWLVNVPSEAGSLTYANASAAGLDLVRYTLQPGYAGPIADALSEELPGDYQLGRRVVLGLNHLTRGTILEQAQAYAIATGGKAWYAAIRRAGRAPYANGYDPGRVRRARAGAGAATGRSRIEMAPDTKDLRDDRQRKAEWMNEQIAERLGNVPQPGVKPAPDARPDDAFSVDAPARTRKAAKAADPK